MQAFSAYTWQHGLPILFFSLGGLVMIRTANGRQGPLPIRMGVVLASIILLLMVGGSAIKIFRHTYDIREDLPLYLCRVIAWVLPVVIWRQSRYWLGIFYFWILAGTLQGIVTPDLSEGFPNYFYFRYWFLHAGMVVAILYIITVLKIRITWKDFWRALVFAQCYLCMIYAVNLLLGSNYSYTMHKPPKATILDLFGPWPWYVFGGEALMVILFLLLMLPWIRKKGGLTTASEVAKPQ